VPSEGRSIIALAVADLRQGQAGVIQLAGQLSAVGQTFAAPRTGKCDKQRAFAKASCVLLIHNAAAGEHRVFDRLLEKRDRLFLPMNKVRALEVAPATM